MGRLLTWTVVALGLALAGIASALLVATRRFDRLVAADRRRLLSEPPMRNAPSVTEEMLAGLPEPAQRYLRYAGVVGRPMAGWVRVRQACRMRPTPAGFSFPITAEQWYRVEPPGFIWDATVTAAGIPIVRGRDGFLAGHGLMTIRIASLYPLVDASGPEMDQASLVRHLSEMPWFPSAFLGDRVTWEAIDDAHVQVTLTNGDLRATGTLEIDPEGRLVMFRSERYAAVGDHFELRPWSTPTYDYGEFEGLRLPVRGAAIWTLTDGTTLPYIEVEILDVASDPPFTP